MNNEDLEVQRVIEFLTACCKAVDDVPWGTEVEFTCPLCGSSAIGRRLEYNGHHWCKCNSCKMTLIE